MKDKNIAILWFGKEWQSTLNFLLWQNINPKHITILDENEKALVPNNINSILWNNYLDNLIDYDIIIKSPGISPYEKKILPFVDKLTSQTQIFFQYYKGKVIWITATKGKSTTSSIVYHTLQSAGYNVKLVWNIGKPVLEEINLEKNYDYIVYELSSYMLEWLKKNNYISILGNIYPDHLWWHYGFENYKNAKLNIFNGSKYNIVNGKLLEFYEDIRIPKDKSNNIKFFGNNTDYYFENNTFFIKWKKVFWYEWIKLLGKHNIENILSVIVLCNIIWIDYKILYNVLKKFKGLAHRLEYIWQFQWIKFYDDAISTTPESTIYAIETFWKQIWCIFLWGEDRSYNFEKLVNTIREYEIKNIVLFPDSWKKIWKLLNKEWNIKYLNIFKTKSMKDAVKFAFENTEKNKICLLSCASPSYSLWKNFEEKWNLFQKYIKKFGE